MPNNTTREEDRLISAAENFGDRVTDLIAIITRLDDKIGELEEELKLARILAGE